MELLQSCTKQCIILKWLHVGHSVQELLYILNLLIIPSWTINNLGGAEIGLFCGHIKIMSESCISINQFV